MKNKKLKLSIFIILLSFLFIISGFILATHMKNKNNENNTINAQFSQENISSKFYLLANETPIYEIPDEGIPVGTGVILSENTYVLYLGEYQYEDILYAEINYSLNGKIEEGIIEYNSIEENKNIIELESVMGYIEKNNISKLENDLYTVLEDTIIYEYYNEEFVNTGEVLNKDSKIYKLFEVDDYYLVSKYDEEQIEELETITESESNHDINNLSTDEDELGEGKDSLEFDESLLNFDEYEALEDEAELDNIILIEKLLLYTHKINIDTNKKYELITEVYPIDHTEELLFSSSDEKIVKVDSLGVITPYKEGTVVITVESESGSIKDECKVVVKNKKVTKITITDMSKRAMGITETYQLKTDISPVDATNKKVAYTSTNPAIATISSNGLITAKKEGTTDIIVSSTDGSNKKAKTKLTVKKQATLLKFSNCISSMKVNTTYDLNSTAVGGGSFKRTYTTSDSTVATVTNGGLVTAKKKGTVIIKAKTFNNKVAQCKITVK